MLSINFVPAKVMTKRKLKRDHYAIDLDRRRVRRLNRGFLGVTKVLSKKLRRYTAENVST
jgi:hypothetical protein